jgi:hypothetical protein
MRLRRRIFPIRFAARQLHLEAIPLIHQKLLVPLHLPLQSRVLAFIVTKRSQQRKSTRLGLDRGLGLGLGLHFAKVVQAHRFQCFEQLCVAFHHLLQLSNIDR